MATHPNGTENQIAAAGMQTDRRQFSVILHTLVEGVGREFTAAEVLRTLPPTRDIDLATRVADTPAVIHTVGVGEIDKRGQLILFNADELAQQLRFIPLNVEDQLTIFLPSQPGDRHVLRFALAPYWRAIQGRGRTDAAEFVQLCFVSSKSPKQAKLNEARAFRSWSKRNSKPFTKDELFSRFPFPHSRWSNFRVLKGELQLCTPKADISTDEANEPTALAHDGTQRAETSSIARSNTSNMTDQLPVEKKAPHEVQNEALALTNPPRALTEADGQNSQAASPEQHNHSEACTEGQSEISCLQIDTTTQTAFEQLIHSTQFHQASTIWQKGINQLKDSSGTRSVPPTWRAMCAHIATRLTDTPLGAEHNQDFTARFIAQATAREPGPLVQGFTQFVAKTSLRDLTEDPALLEVESITTASRECGS